MRVVAEEDDEEAAHKDEEGGAGGVGDLELVAAGDEFTAIPEAAGRFHGHDEDSTGDNSHDPAHDIVHSVKTHKNLDFNGQTCLIDFQRRLLTFWVAKDAILKHKRKFLETPKSREGGSSDRTDRTEPHKGSDQGGA